MPVKIDSVVFSNEFRAETVDWLLANVGDKITAEIDFTVQTFAIASTDAEFIINNRDGYIGTGWITSESAPFADFIIGDKVIVYNYLTITPSGSGNPAFYTIIDKLSDSEIRLSQDVLGLAPATNATSTAEVISVIDPITACSYKWNFIENDEQPSFNSKVDGTEHLLVAKEIDASVATPEAMEFLGAKPYQIGQATIEGTGIDNGTSDGVYKNSFKIIHETYITPFILATQLENILTPNTDS